MDQLVKNKIQEFVKNARIFTAFDVTTALRKLGHFIKHGEVKKVFSSFDFDAVDYDRTLAKNEEFDVKPYFYYSVEHSDSDIEEYEDSLFDKELPTVPSYINLSGDIWKPISEDKTTGAIVFENTNPRNNGITLTYARNTIPSTWKEVVCNVVTPVVDDEEDSEPVEETIVLKVDSRQRCAIPNRIINTYFENGDTLGIWYDEDNNVTVIHHYVDGAWDYSTTLTVDKSGNIRIPLKYLAGTVLDVEYSNTVGDQIYLRGH